MYRGVDPIASRCQINYKAYENSNISKNGDAVMARAKKSKSTENVRERFNGTFRNLGHRATTVAKENVPERTIVNPNIDTEWFVHKLQDLGMSLREYERHPEVQAASGLASRIFRGMRHFGPNDARKFARVTGVDFTEVVRRAGGFTAEDLEIAAIPVTGWIDAKRLVHFKGLKGDKKVIAPPDLGSGAIALRYQTAGSVLDTEDGAVLYCRPLGKLDIAMLNRWCYIKLEDGRYVMRVLKRGASTRVFNLVGASEDAIEGAEVEAASVVEWVRY